MIFLQLIFTYWSTLLQSANAFCVVDPANAGWKQLDKTAPSRYCPARQAADQRIILHSTKDPNSNSDEDANENDDSDNNDGVFFDDFDFVIGGASPASSSSSSSSYFGSGQEDSLNERIRKTQEQDLYRDTKLMKNWQQGDWSVRGFSLDPGDALSDAALENQMNLSGDESNTGGFTIQPNQPTQEPIYVSKVVPDTNSDGKRVWVGRSNGSLVWVRLGTEYTTHFQSKISGSFSSPANDNANNSDKGDGKDEDAPSTVSMKFGSELIREDSMNQQFSQGEGFPRPPEDPFAILAQFSPANNQGDAVTHILSVPEEDFIFTVCEGTGQIQQWHISDDAIDSGAPALQSPVPLSDSIHKGPIVALKTVIYPEAPLLFSVGADGSMALWDMTTADLVYNCQVCLEEISEMTGDFAGSGSAIPQRIVNCADVDDTHIYLGTAAGIVLGYGIKDLVESGSSGGTCPLPNGKFKAHEGGVTAIACGGPGSLGRLSGGGGSATTSSSVLFTGGQEGLVKQWEMLSSPSSDRLENWPKIASQRLPKKAHLFEGHYGPVTAIEAMGGRRPQFLTASSDGTIRTWDVAKGKEEYRMDGFNENLSSLCLQGGSDTEDELLVTNGMNQYVCVHDFSMGISGESIDDFFEQWDD